MRRSRFVAATAGVALTFSGLTVPVAFAEPVTPPARVAQAPDVDVADVPVEELLSYESASGAAISPGQTITIEPDYYDPRLPLLNVYPMDGTFLQWDIELDKGTGAVTLTAPAAPEEQSGSTIVEYGETVFRTRTNEGREVYFAVNFQPAQEQEPAEDGSSLGAGSSSIGTVFSGVVAFLTSVLEAVVPADLMNWGKNLLSS